MAEHLSIHRRDVAPTKREVVYGIEEIRLAHAVLSHKAVEFGGEFDIGRRDVPVIDDGYFFQYHDRSYISRHKVTENLF